MTRHRAILPAPPMLLLLTAAGAGSPAALAQTGLPQTGLAQTIYPGALSSPGNYSLAPADAPPTGEASVAYGSRNMSAASVRMERGLPGLPGVRAFVALGGAQGPDLKGIVPGAKGGVASHGAAVGVEKSFPDGTTISLEGGWQQDRLTFGRNAYRP